MPSPASRDSGGESSEGRPIPVAVLAAAWDDLWKALAVVLAGALLTILALQNFAWNRVRRELLDVALPETRVIAVAPIDVIHAQIVVGVAVGACLALPVVLYHGCGAVDRWPNERIGRRTQALFVPLCVLAFLAGSAVGYDVVGLAAVEFLLHDLGVGSGWSIVTLFEVVAGIALLFGLLAQAAVTAAFLMIAR